MTIMENNEDEKVDTGIECELCGDTGEILEGEFDDFITKKCICRIQDNQSEE